MQTLGALEYAQSAAKIKNAASKNEESEKVKRLKEIIKRLTAEAAARATADAAAAGDGGGGGEGDEDVDARRPPQQEDFYS